MMLAFALPTFSPTLYGSLVAGLIGLVVLAILGRVPLQYSLRNLIVRGGPPCSRRWRLRW